MPAIRYYHQCIFSVASATPSPRPVDVRQRDGTYVRLPWLGMICEAAADTLPGLGRVKILAHDVTSGDGIGACEWRGLESGEHVLGWRCYLSDGNQGVYGVVDKTLWPIIISDQRRRSVPRLMLAG